MRDWIWLNWLKEFHNSIRKNIRLKLDFFWPTTMQYYPGISEIHNFIVFITKRVIQKYFLQLGNYNKCSSMCIYLFPILRGYIITYFTNYRTFSAFVFRIIFKIAIPVLFLRRYGIPRVMSTCRWSLSNAYWDTECEYIRLGCLWMWLVR